MLSRLKVQLCLAGGLCVVAAVLAVTSAGSAATAANDGGSMYLPVIHKPVATLAEQVTVRTIDLPAALEGSAGNWCTWGGCLLGPRLYHAPLADDSTLVGWTDSQGNGYVSLVSDNSVEHWSFPGTAVRGLVAHDDHTFAVTLWDVNAGIIWLSKRDENGGEMWTTNLNSDIARADFWLGDGRLAYGNGVYAAYFTVKGVSGGFTGHHGDQLSYVNDAGVVQADGWDWGCSHSMAQLVAYHPGLDEFAAVCSSDCYPDASIHWVNASHEIYQAGGNCGGLVSAQLGQMATGNQTWKLVFSALEQPCCEGHGIAMATLDGNHQSSYVWLTNTNGQYEQDPAIARIGVGTAAERYLVGWLTSNNGVYRLGIVGSGGEFIKGPENVTAAGIGWGNRDESFRTRVDGRVSWVQAEPNGDVIRLFWFDGAPFLP